MKLSWAGTPETTTNSGVVAKWIALSSEFDFQAVDGTTYFIAVESGYYFRQGNIELSLAGAPSNDNFANRQLLNGAAIWANGGNILATSESNEPSSNGHSVWYSWTASASGSVAVSASGPAYPFVTVFTGNDLSTLIPVPRTYGGGASVFDAVAGITYQIRVDGYQTGNFILGLSLFEGRYPLFSSAYPSEGGSVLLQPSPDTNGMYAAGTSVTITAQPSSGFVLSGFGGSVTTSGLTNQIVEVMNGSQSIYASFYPENDNFAQSMQLAGSSASISGSTDGASNEPGEPGYWCQTVWYSWVAPASGTVTFWLGSANQPRMNIYTGTQVTNLQPVFIFSYGESRHVTSQTLEAVAGMTYQIQVAGYAPSFELQLSLLEGFYALSESAYPPGRGSVLVNPPPDTNGLYAAGIEVSLTAIPAQGWVFSGWSGTQSGDELDFAVPDDWKPERASDIQSPTANQRRFRPSDHDFRYEHNGYRIERWSDEGTGRACPRR
jgi:hypothetical protein